MSQKAKKGETLSKTYNERTKFDLLDAINDKLAALKTDEALRRAQVHVEKAQAQFDAQVEKFVLGTEEARARAFITREMERVTKSSSIQNDPLSDHPRKTLPTQQVRADIVKSAEHHVAESNDRMIEEIKVKVLDELKRTIDRLQESEIRGPSRRSARAQFSRSTNRRGRDRGIGE